MNKYPSLPQLILTLTISLIVLIGLILGIDFIF